ncbi:uncharacterized protein LOC105185668 isoform X3 [Harpegnathos saltator]|uniref:uncharacterized protein LOC105185668 isoform X3 n=1 Tax=Harpegnathos saltator TaxID=610380 RepID=UPI000DBEE3FE|nr:uncharacterized protein LOC105185668 isoform X3 [Harpegnathos saltator]
MFPGISSFSRIRVFVCPGQSDGAVFAPLLNHTFVIVSSSPAERRKATAIRSELVHLRGCISSHRFRHEYSWPVVMTHTSVGTMFILVALFLPNLWNPTAEASVLVADTTMSRMVELNADAPFCALYNDRGIIQKMVLGADPKKVRQMSSNLVADLVETCKASRDRGKVRRFACRKNQMPGGLIYPGTKWCGPGNVSTSYEDLGHHTAEDACCREHDHCSYTIAPHECLRGICNNSPFTRSHCDCDAKLRRCLQNVNTEVANTLGALFFNIIQVTCFKERRPCSQWQRNGYAEAVSDRLCSQYKFQPSDKYVPMMPLNMNM